MVQLHNGCYPLNFNILRLPHQHHLTSKVIMRTGIYTVALSSLSSVFATASPIGDYNILTTNGKITGHPTPNVSNITEFLGILYAQPPVGPLHFASPLPPDSNESFVAVNWVCSNDQVMVGGRTDGNRQGEYVDQIGVSVDFGSIRCQ